MERMSKFEKELTSILEVNRALVDDFNRERLMRKRYYNLVEELKGKIRVFCRIRPASKNEKYSDVIAKCSDPYTVALETLKGHKEFQFDRVFTPEESQEQVFCDTQVRNSYIKVLCFDETLQWWLSESVSVFRYLIYNHLYTIHCQMNTKRMMLCVCYNLPYHM
jgi:hypothetical protein